MLKGLLDIAAAGILSTVVSFVIHQFWVLSIDYLLDPVVKQFYAHAKHWGKRNGHPKLDARKCPDCDKVFKNMPR